MVLGSVGISILVATIVTTNAGIQVKIFPAITAPNSHTRRICAFEYFSAIITCSLVFCVEAKFKDLLILMDRLLLTKQKTHMYRTISVIIGMADSKLRRIK